MKLAIVLLLINFTAVANSQESLSICFEEWRPFAYTENGQLKGKVVKQLALAANKLDIKLEFSELPYKRCIDKVKKGHIDFSLFVDKDDKLQLITPAIASWNIVAVTNEQLTLDSLDDLKSRHNMRIIISQDYQYPNVFTVLVQSLPAKILKVSYYVTNEQEAITLFSLLTHNRADVMLVDLTWASHLKRQHNLPVNISPFILHTAPQFIGYHKASKDKVKLMRSVILSQ